MAADRIDEEEVTLLESRKAESNPAAVAHSVGTTKGASESEGSEPIQTLRYSEPFTRYSSEEDDFVEIGKESLQKLNADNDGSNGSSGSGNERASKSSEKGQGDLPSLRPYSGRVRVPRKKEKIDKYYRKQSDLVENFRKDVSIIEEAERRKKGFPFSSDEKMTQLVAMEMLEDEAMIDRLFAGRKSSGSLDKGDSKHEQKSGMSTAARWLAMATLIVNISLVVAKAAASYLSGSLSIISSLVDSAVDITSGLVIWLTARAIKKHDPYMYPRGRTRLEPLALIIVSVIMGVASIQMIVQSLESVVRKTVDPHVEIASLCIMVATVIVKFILLILCKKFDTDASISVLAQDHRNDCLSNLVALFCAWAASKFWIYLDPIGAIIVSIYIAITWFFTGKEHLTMLSGKSAEPEFINRIVKVCVEHDERIDYIDTVYVYHYGTRYLVEVHVVMDYNMTLMAAHDISEALQNKIESLPEVERAFVHCDYEFTHMPCDEHKVV